MNSSLIEKNLGKYERMKSLTKSSFSFDRNGLNLLIIGLLAVLFGPLVLHWIDGWVISKNIGIEHEYFTVALLGFPYGIYLAWKNRHKWRRLENKAHPIGWVLAIIGIFLYTTKSVELVNLSFPIILLAMGLLLKGIPGVKLNAFSYLLIFLATPNAVPYLLTPFSLPLQAFIANVAGFIIYYVGFTNVQVEGIYISLGGRLVEVAPYCAGLKMLFTSLYVALLLLHWTGLWRSTKKVIALMIGTVIISVTVNIFRNTILSLLYGLEWNDLFHWVHESLGGDLISLAMLALIVVWLDGIERFDSYWKGGESVGILDYGVLVNLPSSLLGKTSKTSPKSNPPNQPESDSDSNSDSNTASNNEE